MPPEAKATVLIVDDEPRMIQFIRMNLELEGYRVIQATNGLEALEKVRSDLPDVIEVEPHARTPGRAYRIASSVLRRSVTSMLPG